MPITYRVLGQSSPAANTLTTIYTVPSATQAVISSITVCNRANTAASFRIAIQPAGAAIDNKHYINFDTPIPSNDTVALSLGLTLGNTDVVAANVSSGSISVGVFGSEIS